MDDLCGAIPDQLLFTAEAPADPDGRNVEFSGADHIKFRIADHDCILSVCLLQQIADHSILVFPGMVIAGPAYDIKITGHVKMLKNLPGSLFRLAGGNALLIAF